MKKYLLSLSVLAVAVAAMAFTNVPAPTERVDTKYIFNGTDLSDATDPEFWEEIDLEAPGCAAGSDLPCTVITNMSIASWLSGKDAETVLDQASSRKD